MRKCPISTQPPDLRQPLQAILLGQWDGAKVLKLCVDTAEHLWPIRIQRWFSQDSSVVREPLGCMSKKYLGVIRHAPLLNAFSSLRIIALLFTHHLFGCPPWNRKCDCDKTCFTCTDTLMSERRWAGLVAALVWASATWIKNLVFMRRWNSSGLYYMLTCTRMNSSLSVLLRKSSSASCLLTCLDFSLFSGLLKPGGRIIQQCGCSAAVRFPDGGNAALGGHQAWGVGRRLADSCCHLATSCQVDEHWAPRGSLGDGRNPNKNKVQSTEARSFLSSSKIFRCLIVRVMMLATVDEWGKVGELVCVHLVFNTDAGKADKNVLC